MHLGLDFSKPRCTRFLCWIPQCNAALQRALMRFEALHCIVESTWQKTGEFMVLKRIIGADIGCQAQQKLTNCRLSISPPPSFVRRNTKSKTYRQFQIARCFLPMQWPALPTLKASHGGALLHCPLKARSGGMFPRRYRTAPIDRPHGATKKLSAKT